MDYPDVIIENLRRKSHLASGERSSQSFLPGLVSSLALFEEGLGHLDLLKQFENQTGRRSVS
jgi:hypothetical protein